ncbi:MAG: hypothetical protein HZC54_24920 [Verrucomicrobia bacterium]|nr:hypothetical protein [Verrucomicrobiota bacterium]
MTANRKFRISVFVAVWLTVFCYESLRYNYLGRWLRADLPKVMFLFPPAGWIMFYHVDDTDGRAEVWGRIGDKRELIDPHRIFATRWIGCDNIRRNVLITVLDPAHERAFCRYLRRKFPACDGFDIVQVWTPSVTKEPGRQIRQNIYRCD